MQNLQLYDPFAGAGLDELFSGFFKPIRVPRDPAVSIKLDVAEKGNSYVVHAEIPGVKKDDIQVTIEGNQVTIAAEVKKVAESKDGAPSNGGGALRHSAS